MHFDKNAHMIHVYSCQKQSLVIFVLSRINDWNFLMILFGMILWHLCSYESYEYPCKKSDPWLFTFSIWKYIENYCHLLNLVEWKEPVCHFGMDIHSTHMSIHVKNHPDELNKFVWWWIYSMIVVKQKVLGT